MIVETVEVRGFRSLIDDRLDLAPGLTVAHGPNGAGKTNLLEAIFFALTGASCRTNRAREMIRFGEPLARVEAGVSGPSGKRLIASAVTRDQGRIHTVDGRDFGPDDALERPAVAVFLPDRLELVKGPPQVRRAHLDRFAAALSASNAEARRRYGAALAQRNALLSRIRGGRADADALDAWDAELAVAGWALTEVRMATVSRLIEPFARLADELGLAGDPAISYRPRSSAADVAELTAELGERRAADLERGHSTHGPHLDDVVLSFAGRSLRSYGSQGQQRVGLLSLLMAEREVLESTRGVPPLMLLDDVMSELDPARRELLTAKLSAGGQALITATERDHVPTTTTATIELADGAMKVGVS